MCPFCFGYKKVEVIAEPLSGDQTLKDAIKRGQKIVELDCPFCTEDELEMK